MPTAANNILASETPSLLTLTEAAKLLHLQRSTLRNWRLNKQFLTFRKIGGRVLVARKDIEAFIERSACKPTRS